MDINIDDVVALAADKLVNESSSSSSHGEIIPTKKKRTTMRRTQSTAKSLHSKFSWLRALVSNNNNNNNRNHGGAELSPAMPRNMKQFILKMGDNPNLILRKKLFGSDVKAQYNRLTIPARRWSAAEFLTQRELDEVSYGGVEVTVVDPLLTLHRLHLRRIEFGLPADQFRLTKQWSTIVTFNGLRSGDVIQLWFFRDNQSEPCFALVNLGQ